MITVFGEPIVTSRSLTSSTHGPDMMNGHLNGDDMNGGDHWPKHVGIVNMEVYFPSQYVEQSELEGYDQVGSGKYTIGLGQTKMGFCDDREDINSLCLTAVDRLIQKTPGLTYKNIGRLEVGTETLVDKSKSVKSVLMNLFKESGNSDVEGADSTNACYGGTAALFNCISWIESSYWDGRYAIAVAGDIAVYASGNARPTGGAGAVAMLIGPNASLVFERGLRATHTQHVYDFYKPNMESEYPVVDGKLSIQCYLASLDKCYQLYKEKAAKMCKIQNGRTKGSLLTVNEFDAIVFHSPFCKLVQKSFARLDLNDFVEASNTERSSKYEGMESFSSIELEKTYFDRDVEKAFMAHSLKSFQEKTKPSLNMSTNVGNMYTASLYGGLASYICSKPSEELVGNRVALFSYGSGLISSFFSLKVRRENLDLITTALSDLNKTLDCRKKVEPSEFSKIMQLRQDTHHAAPYQPTGSTSNLSPGTWYISNIDESHRRSYSKTEVLTNGYSH